MKMKTRIASIILGTAVLASPLSTVINQDAGVVYAWENTLPESDDRYYPAKDFGFMPDDSTIKNGELDVPEDAVFMLKFNRYVTNNSIIDNNISNITVYEIVDGVQQRAKVTIANLPKEYEDTIEDKDLYRNFLSINFEEYKPSTMYKIVVGDNISSTDEDGQLPAKLDKGFEITFTSAEKVEEPPVDPEEPPVETPVEKIVVNSKAKYLNGFEDGTIRPDTKVTRAQVAKILTEIIESAPDVENPPVINDLKDDQWYSEYTDFVVAKGIMQGDDKGNFKPNDAMTRAEIVTTITNLENNDVKKEKEEEEGFNDLTDKHWAYDNIMSAYSAGHIKGFPDGSFRPNTEVSRAQAAQIINNAIGKEVDLDVYEDQIKTYPDLNDSHWGYKAMIKGTIKVK